MSPGAEAVLAPGAGCVVIHPIYTSVCRRESRRRRPRCRPVGSAGDVAGAVGPQDGVVVLTVAITAVATVLPMPAYGLNANATTMTARSTAISDIRIVPNSSGTGMSSRLSAIMSSLRPRGRRAIHSAVWEHELFHLCSIIKFPFLPFTLWQRMKKASHPAPGDGIEAGFVCGRLPGLFEAVRPGRR